MNIQLSEHFTYQKLLRFSAPSILMMVFLSIYSVVDGIFVSNYAGSIPFAAVNIVWPFVQILGAIGFMLGSGGSALVARTMGEGDLRKAHQIFSMLIYTAFFIGIICSIFGLLLLRPILIAFGINGDLLKECLIYGYTLFPALCTFMLQFMFQSFLVVAERPKLGFWITLLAGCTNILLDILFVALFRWGIFGAALASVLSQIIGAGIPFIYFILPNSSPLRLVKCGFYPKAFIKSATNGASEFISNISMSVVSTLYNYQMLKFLGESGVIAFGVICYITFIFVSLFLGYSMGTNPIVSYHYGANNKKELTSLFHKNLIFIGIFAVIITLFAEFSAQLLARIFVSYDEYLLELTTFGFRIYAFSFLLAGFNIYASAFFTALNNGLVSATISCCRTLLFECGCVLILPIFFGINGIWCAVIVAETLALIVSSLFLILFRKKYGY